MQQHAPTQQSASQTHAKQLNRVPISNPHYARRRSRLIAAQAVPVVFEPQVDSQALTAQLVVLSATAATAAYWWWSVVPSARRTLAKEKRAGPLAQYLLDLQSNPDKRVERWFYTDWLQQLQRRQELARAAAAKRAGSLMQPSVGLQEAQQQQQQQLEQAHGDTDPESLAAVNAGPEGVDDGRQPSFWSLDNPILATATMLAVVALISSILHG